MLEFAPASWQVPGFWEDYYDGDPAAAEIVKTELSKILGTQRDSSMPDLSGPMTSLELQAAAEQLVTAQGTDPWKGLMLVLLHYIKELSVPKELSDVLVSVDAYWSSGKGTPETLEAAKGKCRDFLNEFEMHTHLDSPDTQMRAVLRGALSNCLLDAALWANGGPVQLRLYEQEPDCLNADSHIQEQHKQTWNPAAGRREVKDVDNSERQREARQDKRSNERQLVCAAPGSDVPNTNRSQRHEVEDVEGYEDCLFRPIALGEGCQPSPIQRIQPNHSRRADHGDSDEADANGSTGFAVFLRVLVCRRCG